MEAHQHHPHGWIVPALAGLANGSAWLHAWLLDNVSIGAVVSFCTIAVPAVVGAIVYAIQKLGPVYLGYIAERDKVRSSSLSGQMERLNQNLEAANERGAAHAKLAAIFKEQADRLRQVNDLDKARIADQDALIARQAASLDEMTASLARIGARVEDLNTKLHDERRASVGYIETNKLLMSELEEYKARLGPLAARVGENATRIDALSDFGSKVADAASDLPHRDDNHAPPGDHR